jgi:hypothetical protein
MERAWASRTKYGRPEWAEMQLWLRRVSHLFVWPSFHPTLIIDIVIQFPTIKSVNINLKP